MTVAAPAGGGGGGGGGREPGPTILFTAAISDIFLTGALGPSK